MTVSLMVPRSATMPGYNNNNNIDLDEVQSIPRYCFLLNFQDLLLFQSARLLCLLFEF